MRVVGLDLSLASTGIAGHVPGSGAWTVSIKTEPADGDRAQLARLRRIRRNVLDYARGADLVVVEGLTPNSKTGQHLTRAGLWHLVMERIDAMDIPWAEISPGQVKKYAAGRGNAGKDEVLAAVIRRYPAVEVNGSDEADALVLAAMGADHLQVSTLPTVPQTHAAALDKVAWPEIGGRTDD